MSINFDGSFGGCDVSGYHIHCSGFSCTVWSQKSIDFAFLYFKGKVVNLIFAKIKYRKCPQVKQRMGEPEDISIKIVYDEVVMKLG